MTSGTSIPTMLIQALDNESLKQFLVKLKKTRRRTCLFAINGSTVITTRRRALDAVTAEIQRRAIPPKP